MCDYLAMKAIPHEVALEAEGLIENWCKRSAPKHPDPAVTEDDLRQVGMLIWRKIEPSYSERRGTVLNCLSRSLKNHMIDVYRSASRRQALWGTGEESSEAVQIGDTCERQEAIDMKDLAANGPVWFKKLLAHASASDRHLHYLSSNQYACRHAGLDPERHDVRKMVAELVGFPA